MTRRRWIADEFSGDKAALTGSNAYHLATVLRARAGQQFDVAVDGALHRAVVSSVANDRIEFELHERSEAATALSVTLLLAIFKFDRMEWAIEKATELGVASIVPVVARRTDSHLASAAAKRVERWRKIAKEASQQSRRVSPPEITEPTKLKAALESLSCVPLKIVCSEAEEQTSLASLLRLGEESCIAIGPEGGWAEDELDQFRSAGWQSASLGSTVLRAETAAITALAIASAFPQG
jgi:16S rRNA (uracil1498-N3)-methyltransferase